MCKHAFIFSLKLFGVEFLSLAIKILTQLPVSIPFFHSKKRNLPSSQTEALGVAGPSSAPMMLPLQAGPSLSSAVPTDTAWNGLLCCDQPCLQGAGQERKRCLWAWKVTMPIHSAADLQRPRR